MKDLFNQARTTAIAALLSVVVTSCAHHKVVITTTNEGKGEAFSLSLADSGITGLRLGSQPLPLTGTGGFTISEWEAISEPAPVEMYRNDFSSGTEWMPSVNANPGSDIAAEAIADGDNTFVRVGEGEHFGHGVKPGKRIAVEPGMLCEIGWRGRVPDGSSNFIIYVHVFDRDGNDITPDVPAPKGWAYSRFSFTHYQYELAPGKTNTWETMTLRYRISERVYAIEPAFCLWRGTYADVDDMTVTRLGQTRRHDVDFDSRELVRTPHGPELILTSTKHALALQAAFRAASNLVEIDVAVRDTSPSPRPRALAVEFRLPVRLEGWQWHKDWREDQTVEQDRTCANTGSVCGHPMSVYPFTAVSHDGVGLALGTPFSSTAVEARRVDSEGITSCVDLGLWPHGKDNGNGHFSLLVFPFRGNWGFRSAAKVYHRLYADEFRSRTTREGLWFFPLRPTRLPSNPEDFGFTFWEGWSDNPADRECARELGINIHPYTEAWGLRQSFPEAKTPLDMPPVPERLAQLREWAEDSSSDAKWRGMPRPEAAQAVLNSLPVASDGSHPFSVDKYSVWNHWWRTNPDPNLPRPNRATLCWDYLVEPRLEHADGIYLDSVSPGTADYLNIRPEHLDVAASPLTTDPEMGIPAATGFAHQVAFVRWLGERLHSRGKILQGNVFGISHRFHAPLIDVFGNEVGSWGNDKNRKLAEVEPDTSCCVKRFYAFHRPVCNLLQEGNFTKPVPELTHEQVKRYIDHQLFYAFYPGISTIGGEEKPGYRGWKRYFDGNTQCDRDRELFKEAIPLIRRLNRAGWEAETGVRCELRNVLLERYGCAAAGEVLITVRNANPEPVKATLVLDPATENLFAGNRAAYTLSPLRSEGSPTVEGNEKNTFIVPLAPWETSVLLLQ